MRSSTTLTLVAVVGAVIAVFLSSYASSLVSNMSGAVFRLVVRKMLPNSKIAQDIANRHDIDIIGAGFGRTGTGATRAALDSLGFPTYHFGEMFRSPTESEKWHTIATTKDKAERQKLLREVLGSYRAALDFPAGMYWKDLMEMYPKAKVLLGGQSAAEDWAQAAAFAVPSEYTSSKSIREVFTRGPILGPGLWFFFHLNPFGMKVANHFNTGYFQLYRKDPKEFTKMYNEWVAEVKKTVPADRLLEYNIKEGWEPLSKFLGIDKPKDAFPTVNEHTITTFLVYVMAIVGWLTILLPAIIGVVVWRKFGTQIERQWGTWTASWQRGDTMPVGPVGATVAR